MHYILIALASFIPIYILIGIEIFKSIKFRKLKKKLTIDSMWIEEPFEAKVLNPFLQYKPITYTIKDIKDRHVQYIDERGYVFSTTIKSFLRWNIPIEDFDTKIRKFNIDF